MYIIIRGCLYQDVEETCQGRKRLYMYLSIRLKLNPNKEITRRLAKSSSVLKVSQANQIIAPNPSRAVNNSTAIVRTKAVLRERRAPTMIKGRLPIDIMLYILDWAKEHEEELKENWRRISNKEKLLEIKN